MARAIKFDTTQKMAVLEIGAGVRKRHGGVSLDINLETKPDVLHDLNIVPYPFGDSSFDVIYADHVLEHLEDVLRTMGELHRIAKPSALLVIWVPYYTSRWSCIDPTHRHFFTADSMSYFDFEHPFFELYKYTTSKYRVKRIVFNERWPTGGVRYATKWLANRWPEKYEAYLNNIIPLDEITFYLQVVK